MTADIDAVVKRLEAWVAEFESRGCTPDARVQEWIRLGDLRALLDAYAKSEKQITAVTPPDETSSST